VIRPWPYPKPQPDIDDVVYATTLPPGFPAQMTGRTVLADRPNPPNLYPIHRHTAFMDRDGNGVTDVVASHYHNVRDGKILPDASDGHTHNTTNLPAGHGAPIPYYPPGSL
jgi:hypothetical protein